MSTSLEVKLNLSRTLKTSILWQSRTPLTSYTLYRRAWHLRVHTFSAFISSQHLTCQPLTPLWLFSPRWDHTAVQQRVSALILLDTHMHIHANTHAHSPLTPPTLGNYHSPGFHTQPILLTTLCLLLILIFTEQLFSPEGLSSLPGQSACPLLPSPCIGYQTQMWQGHLGSDAMGLPPKPPIKRYRWDSGSVFLNPGSQVTSTLLLFLILLFLSTSSFQSKLK